MSRNGTIKNNGRRKEDKTIGRGRGRTSQHIILKLIGEGKSRETGLNKETGT